MVAIDESADSLQALNEVTAMMNKKTDSLYLLTVVELITQRYAFTISQYPVLTETQAILEKEARARLKRIGHKCLAQGIKTYALLATAVHMGEMICKAAERKEIDILALGRRGLGSFARFLLGSTSRYCLENAVCNVFVVKEGIAPSEIHDDKKLVLEAEEKERERRIEEEEKLEEKILQTHEKNRKLSAELEEEERSRRIKESTIDKTAQENATKMASQVHHAVLDEKETLKKLKLEGKNQENLHSKFDVEIFNDESILNI